MGCEACNVKFSFFKRKRKCTDCLRYFCSECVIKRQDRSVSCDSCSILSRRPVLRAQIAQIRVRDLRQYLLAKQISVKGCVEKDDLIALLLAFANTDSQHFDSQSDSSSYRYQFGNSEPYQETDNSAATGGSNTEETVFVGSSSVEAGVQLGLNTEGECQLSEARDSSPSHLEAEFQSGIVVSGNVEIEELSGSDFSPTSNGPEPLVEEVEDSSQAETTIEEGNSPEPPEAETVVQDVPVIQSGGLVSLSDINDLSQLESLSVKQLKHLLSTNRVDHKGCIERSELIKKASTLWGEYKQSRADVDKLQEGELCKICWDAPIECVILECGHVACCITCGKQMSECPICKQYIVRVVRFFKA